MVLFNYTSKELTAKIVYYGPGLCGKTTNLQFIYENLPAHVKKGKMLSLATKTDRSLFFDFLPIDLGRIRGMRTRVQLYTVPGQVFYNSTRKLVLKGADGIVFVADSQQKMMESNAESYRNLEENLKEIGLKLEEMPLVMQFNKRDLPHLSSVEEMNTQVNRHNAPFYEAVATTGIGVEDTLKAITKLVLNHLAAKYNLGTAQEPRGAVPEETEVPTGSPSLAAPVAGEGTGIALSGDPGEMEIERMAGGAVSRSPEAGRPSSPFAQGGAADGSEAGEERLLESAAEPVLALRSDSPAGEPASVPGIAEDLEFVDLGEVGEPAPVPTLGKSAVPEPAEDLSELLEELPPEPGEEAIPLLEEPFPDFTRRPAHAPPASEKPSPRMAPVPVVAPVPAEMGAPVPLPRPAATAPDADGAISPLDPLGIGDGTGEEPLPARAIQVGPVTPGREHEVIVPLEMSVEGRTVRLNLRMTLTLSR